MRQTQATLASGNPGLAQPMEKMFTRLIRARETERWRHKTLFGPDTTGFLPFNKNHTQPFSTSGPLVCYAHTRGAAVSYLWLPVQLSAFSKSKFFHLQGFGTRPCELKIRGTRTDLLFVAFLCITRGGPCCLLRFGLSQGCVCVCVFFKGTLGGFLLVSVFKTATKRGPKKGSLKEDRTKFRSARLQIHRDFERIPLGGHE